MSELPPAPGDPGPVEAEKPGTRSVTGWAAWGVVLVFLAFSLGFGFLIGLSVSDDQPTPIEMALDPSKPDCVRHINGRLLEAGVTNLQMLQQMVEGAGVEEAEVTVVPYRTPELEYVIVTGWYCR